MNAYEVVNLAISALTLYVLHRHFNVLRAYAGDTKTLARIAVEQLPRPCLVVKQLPDPSDMAVLEGRTVSLPDKLRFANIGPAPGVNCRYRVRATGDIQLAWYQLPELGPAEVFESVHSLNAVSPDCVVIIEYESVAGSRYRTEQTLEGRKRVTKSTFRRPPSTGQTDGEGFMAT